MYTAYPSVRMGARNGRIGGREALVSSSADWQGSNPGALASAILLLFVLACSAVFPSAASALEAHDYKMAGDATRMRVVINFDTEPDPKWFLLRGPHRLVIDLP